MPTIIHGGVANTADPVPQPQLERDVARSLDAIAAGGIAIIPLDLTYAIVANQPDAIRRIFTAKNRSYDKPCGLFGSWRISNALHTIDARGQEVARVLADEEGLPYSIVAPFRRDHPFLAQVDPFVIQSSSKHGTMDMVINGGYWLTELARQSLARNLPVFGSSSNRSLQGSKYRLDEVEPEVLSAVDIAFDYGLSRYATPLGLSSTIIDFRDFSTVRIGHRYDELKGALARRFAITLRDPA